MKNFFSRFKQAFLLRQYFSLLAIEQQVPNVASTLPRVRGLITIFAWVTRLLALHDILDFSYWTVTSSCVVVFLFDHNLCLLSDNPHKTQLQSSCHGYLTCIPRKMSRNRTRKSLGLMMFIMITVSLLFEFQV